MDPDGCTAAVGGLAKTSLRVNLGGLGHREADSFPGDVVEQYDLALISILLALAITTWLHGVYYYIQMVRHRRPGLTPFRIGWSAEHLTERGREFRRRALRSYAAFGLVAAAMVLVGHLLGER
jgi:hypothetical protein